MESFYWEKSRAEALLAQEKKGLFKARSPSLHGKDKGSNAEGLSFLWGIEEALVADYLTDPGQKTPDPW